MTRRSQAALICSVAASMVDPPEHVDRLVVELDLDSDAGDLADETAAHVATTNRRHQWAEAEARLRSEG
jgi:hypothetical protein